MLNDPVLVLNQNYQPLNICQVRRAVVMLLQGRAEVIENNSSPVRSPTFSMISPSVVRVGQQIKFRRLKTKLTRRRVFLRDRYTCLYCGVHTRELTLDHLIPRHQGGAHTWVNLVSACKSCNQRKAGRTPKEANMRLLKKPYKPTLNSHHILYPFGIPPEWQKYMAWAVKLS